MMHKANPLQLAILLSVSAALAACSPGPNGIDGHAITFDNNSVVLHAPGHPAAHIDNGGDLRIGGKAIDLTSAQRDVLKTYYGQAVAVAAARSGTDLHVAARAVTSTLRDAFGSKHAASRNGKGTMLAGVQRMCRDVAALNATQAQATSDIPAFAPYASASTGIHCDAGMASPASPVPAPAIAGSASSAAPPAAASSAASSSFIDRAIDDAITRASRKLRTQDITISNGTFTVAGGNTLILNGNGASTQPNAKITPQGDLLIKDRPVAVTPAQRALLLDYRQQIIGIADAGAAIGKQGAELGVHAAGMAIAAVFSGTSSGAIRKRIDTEAAGVRASTAKLCDRMPALLAQQQKLAAALPAFKPYATMTQKDIDDCRADALKDDPH